MMKKLSFLLLSLTFSLCIHAQFQEGKGYIGASLTGLNLHYNGHDKLNVGLEFLSVQEVVIILLKMVYI